MSQPPDPTPVLAVYPIAARPTAIHYLAGAGGFSGARFWRVEMASEPLCLRCWPAEYPHARDLNFIHRVLHHVARNGFAIVPVPLEDSSGATYVAHSGHLWELTPWLPGKAVFSEQPTETRLVAAMECLARFHRAGERFAWPEASPCGTACPAAQPSPGIRRRMKILQEWLTGRATQLENALRQGLGWPAMGPNVERLLRLLPQHAPVVADVLTQCAKCPVPLQPCIRDVWHDHLLFEGDRVTGLIDFGSMGVDNPSCDVARLLGSLTQGDSSLWDIGLQAYTTIRPVTEVELRLVEAFDRSGVLLGALNWAAWVFLDGRVFDEPQAALRRMDALMTRLTQAPRLPPADLGPVL